jgi:hypothetical protein
MISIFLGCFWRFCCDGWTRWSHYQFGMDQATDLLDFGLEIYAISGELSFQFSISLFHEYLHLIPLANLSLQLLDWICTHKRLCISKQALHSIGLWIWVCLQGDDSSWWAADGLVALESMCNCAYCIFLCLLRVFWIVGDWIGSSGKCCSDVSEIPAETYPLLENCDLLILVQLCFQTTLTVIVNFNIKVLVFWQETLPRVGTS